MTDIGPGSIVVCVNTHGIPKFAKPLREGVRYVVREVVPNCAALEGDRRGPGLCLRGIKNLPYKNYPGEPCYCITRFRPIGDEDSAIFERMVADLPQKVDVLNLTGIEQARRNCGVC